MSTVQAMLTLPCRMHALASAITSMHQPVGGDLFAIPRATTQHLCRARRQLAAVALSVSVSMGICVPEASALVQGFSPMEALKNKDYGKSRMT